MEIEKMRRKSDRHGADRRNGRKSKQGDSTEFNNQSMMHWFIQANRQGKEDSAVGCHFGRRDFGLRGALRSIYARTGSSSTRQLSLAHVESA
jgi:hypothetical protein